jgi:3-phenylpropionate/trans-cinnamate dioxygenase ferredoxin reductase component
MTTPRSVVVVGESIAGITTARELRGRGYAGTITIVGAEPHGAYARPPLSKVALYGDGEALDLGYSYDGLDLTIVRSPATRLDLAERAVTTASGNKLDYDALVIASGAEPRRLAASRQRGELVLRTVDDAERLRSRLKDAASAVVVGAGFLGMEVASACVRQGVAVTVIDVASPLHRVLGEYLSHHIGQRASEHGIRFIQAGGPVRLAGNPVRGVLLSNGTTLTADVVATCAGDTAATGWLRGTGLADEVGVPVDATCSTSVAGVYAAGDVAYVRGDPGRGPRRAPFWSNAVAQAKVAAASVLGEQASIAPRDDYFWTEILGLAIKVVGPLPVAGPPTTIEGSIADGDALLEWVHPGGATTVVSWGRRIPVPRLRAMARAEVTAR